MLHHSLFPYRKSLLIFTFVINSVSSQADDFCPKNFKPFNNSIVDSKLRLVYVTSPTSYECKELTRDLLNNSQVNATLRRNFDCYWINSSSPSAKIFLRKFRVKKLPAIVLIATDIGLFHKCDISIESRLLLDQASFFLSAISISNQVNDLMRLNHLSHNEAQLKLAKAYVANDIKKKQAGDKHYYAHKYTLGIKSLAIFQREYLMEWELRSALSKTGE